MDTRSRIALSLLLVLAAGACSQQSAEQEQRRRRLLTPPDTSRERVERERKTRVFDDEGKLLESDQKITWFTLPRGFPAPIRTEHQWYMQSDQVSADALDHYIEAHVQGAEVSRSIDGSLLLYTHAKSADDDQVVPLSFQIGALRGAHDACELYVREPLPAARRLSASEAEAQLKARREHAE